MMLHWDGGGGYVLFEWSLTYSQNLIYRIDFCGPVFHVFSKKTSDQRPPVNNSHNFWAPMVAVIHRLECLSYNWTLQWL